MVRRLSDLAPGCTLLLRIPHFFKIRYLTLETFPSLCFAVMLRKWIFDIFAPSNSRIEARNGRRRGNQRINPPPNDVRVVPRKFSSPLSIDHPENDVNAPDPDPSQLGVFQNLPHELRRLIWLQCMGKMTLHLHIESGKLCHTLCRSPNPETCEEIGGTRGCWQHSTTENGPLSKRKIPSLLLTCRQM